MIDIPDGQFNVASGNGTVGGPLFFGSSGTSRIGSGPWSGTYMGVTIPTSPFTPPLTLGAPTLTIGNGSATISGVSSLLGQQNGGYFSQVLQAAYNAGTTYTLSVDVNAGSLLGASLFGNTGVGIALTNGTSGAILASTLSAPSTALSVSLLSGTTYRLTLSYLAGSGVSGPIGLRLIDMPSGVANVSLLNSVSFSNVTLDAQAVPEPASFVMLGLGTLGTAVVAGARRSRANRALALA